MKFEGIGDVMTEKIRLRDGTEFTLVPMGITETDKLRIFKIVSNLTYDETLLNFTNENNISQIEYILADNSVGATYQDCVSFQWIMYIPNEKIDDNTVANVYEVALSTDDIERKIKATQQFIDNAVAELTILIATLGGNI